MQGLGNVGQGPPLSRCSLGKLEAALFNKLILVPLCLQKLEGSKCKGQLLIFGATNWDLIGRKEVPKQQGMRTVFEPTARVLCARCPGRSWGPWAGRGVLSVHTCAERPGGLLKVATLRTAGLESWSRVCQLTILPQ